MTAATMIASPALALWSSSIANADDLSSIGPIAIGGYTETLTYDTTTGGFDNYLVGNYDGYPYDLDVYVDPSGSGNSEVLLTVPLLFQGGFTDIDGTISPISSVLNPADFLNSDIGLIDLGGTPDPALGVVSLGPFDLGGYEDTFSINSANFAIDNFATGLSNGLPFDLDFATGAPGSNTSDFLLTVPLLFQAGVEDVAGAITPIFSIDYADFLNPDFGLSLIGGL
ncbi:hypothetical protein [Mycobacterium sp.]|uniref:hypothetical protein n=1 Tax=Mycobacterium sp. TaxID=1785 RepID=UPI003D0F4EBD